MTETPIDTMPDTTTLTPEQRAELKRHAAGTTCHHTVIDVDLKQVEPCGMPATGHRWYQDEDHEDCLSPACDEHANEGGRIIAALLALAEERDELAKRVAVIERAALERAAQKVEPFGLLNGTLAAKEIRSLVPPEAP